MVVIVVVTVVMGNGGDDAVGGADVSRGDSSGYVVLGVGAVWDSGRIAGDGADGTVCHAYNRGDDYCGADGDSDDDGVSDVFVVVTVL